MWNKPDNAFTSVSHSCLLWVAGGLQILILEIKEKVDTSEKIFTFIYLVVSGWIR